MAARWRAESACRDYCFPWGWTWLIASHREDILESWLSFGYEVLEESVTDGEVTLSMALPVDPDGFLRRECPTCEREFKWLPAAEGDEDTADLPNGGYFCPYCGVHASPDSWYTKAQLNFAQRMVEVEVVEPMLQKAADDIARTFRSVGMTTRSAPSSRAEEPDPLTEDDDMARVDFGCHPSEPVKVLDDWQQPVRCLICGEPNT